MSIQERIKNDIAEELRNFTPEEREGMKHLTSRLEVAMVGACEIQQEIDIQRATEFYCDHCNGKPRCVKDTDGEYRIDGFTCTARMLLAKAMKGGNK